MKFICWVYIAIDPMQKLLIIDSRTLVTVDMIWILELCWTHYDAFSPTPSSPGCIGQETCSLYIYAPQGQVFHITNPPLNNS